MKITNTLKRAHDPNAPTPISEMPHFAEFMHEVWAFPHRTSRNPDISKILYDEGHLDLSPEDPEYSSVSVKYYNDSEGHFDVIGVVRYDDLKKLVEGLAAGVQFYSSLGHSESEAARIAARAMAEQFMKIVSPAAKSYEKCHTTDPSHEREPNTAGLHADVEMA